MKINSYIIVERAVEESVHTAFAKAYASGIPTTDSLKDIVSKEVMGNLEDVIIFEEQEIKIKE